jgi:hypothetical protein
VAPTQPNAKKAPSIEGNGKRLFKVVSEVATAMTVAGLIWLASMLYGLDKRMSLVEYRVDRLPPSELTSGMVEIKLALKELLERVRRLEMKSK